jgi:hypothetical protein
MKKKNMIADFDKHNFELEFNKLEENLKTYLHLEQSFEMITGSKEIKTIDYLNTFITSLSKFPNVEASVKLLDLETPYNFIISNIYEFDLSKIDVINKTIKKEILEELEEKFTYRLNNDTQADYEILAKIAELYTKLQNKGSAKSIYTTDSINYNVDVIGLHQISQIR